MTKIYRIFQSFFWHTKIRFDISFFENENIFRIHSIDTRYQLFIFLRKHISDSIDQFIVMTMGLTTFFESCIIRPCLLIIRAEITLCHKSIINNIIPITDKIGMQTESIKKFAPYFITSFTINIDNFIILNQIFPFR